MVDIGLTYVRVETEDGPALLPNVQALAAVVLAIPAPARWPPARAAYLAFLSHPVSTEEPSYIPRQCAPFAVTDMTARSLDTQS